MCVFSSLHEHTGRLYGHVTLNKPAPGSHRGVVLHVVVMHTLCGKSVYLYVLHRDQHQSIAQVTLEGVKRMCRAAGCGPGA